jgi:hypothetical protein
MITLCLKKRDDLLGEDLQPDQTHHLGRFDPRLVKIVVYIYYIVTQNISVIFALYTSEQHLYRPKGAYLYILKILCINVFGFTI